MSGDVELARRRLTFNLEGLGPNDGYIEGYSPSTLRTRSLLPTAVNSGNLEMTALLIEYGAELNAPCRLREGETSTEKHWNPIVAALWRDDEAMLELLLKAGADPSYGLAAASGPVLGRLLELGADPKSPVASCGLKPGKPTLEEQLEALGWAPGTKPVEVVFTKGRT